MIDPAEASKTKISFKEKWKDYSKKFCEVFSSDKCCLVVPKQYLKSKVIKNLTGEVQSTKGLQKLGFIVVLFFAWIPYILCIILAFIAACLSPIVCSDKFCSCFPNISDCCANLVLSKIYQKHSDNLKKIANFTEGKNKEGENQVFNERFENRIKSADKYRQKDKKLFLKNTGNSSLNEYNEYTKTGSLVSIKNTFAKWKNGHVIDGVIKDLIYESSIKKNDDSYTLTCKYVTLSLYSRNLIKKKKTKK